ncbi:hypothetical protein GUJ93_ZPchr0001g31106 [Zizania palustris]|uniref:Uncharacterized protein n=1 Tax=Zizania palustris TaxID=103762 RepID=A0A8J5R716_ZIZPA|nr:hypothetical protein GUJ93_ZPchr0001g31106 [Zizania palustris]
MAAVTDAYPWHKSEGFRLIRLVGVDPAPLIAQRRIDVLDCYPQRFVLYWFYPNGASPPMEAVGVAPAPTGLTEKKLLDLTGLPGRCEGVSGVVAGGQSGP